MTDDKREQFNTRLSKLTHQQITELAEQYGLNKTEVVTLAIDRLYTELQRKKETEKPR